MRQQPWQECKKDSQVSAVLTEDAQWFLEQLCLPIQPRDQVQHKRDRAIQRSGLPEAKAYRLWYWNGRQHLRLWQEEAYVLWEAYKTHVKKNELKATMADDNTRALREARFMRGLQRELDLAGHQGVRQPPEIVAADAD